MNLSHFSTLRIPAGRVESINAEGRNFYVVYSPVDLEIKWNGAEFAIYGQGAGIEDMPDGQTFKRLEVKNPSAADIIVKIYIGGPLYRDSRFAVIEPQTLADGWNGTQLAATTGVTFDGIPSGIRVRRKCIQVTNLDANLLLQLRDDAGHVVLSVFPETSITLPISGPVEVYNQNGSPVACNISEIWWAV
jgi:hypothetical protein